MAAPTFIQPMTYVALGDSLTAGVGAMFRRGFPYTYRDMLARYFQRPVYLRSLAKSGVTTYRMLELLKTPSVREAIQSADVITLSVGGNDLIQTFKQYVRTGDESLFVQDYRVFKDHCKQIMNTILEIKQSAPGPYMIRWLECYNPFPANPLAVKWINTYNRVIKQYTIYPQVSVAPLNNAFFGKEKDLLSADQIHPNPHGHYLIARSLFYTGMDPLK